ncbi:MAG TPA: hypothetical protein VFH45_12785, partial [Acidimicrobiales bacterium]|nr:hypothetical protein [Acidimicrobiales bacterium]
MRLGTGSAGGAGAVVVVVISAWKGSLVLMASIVGDPPGAEGAEGVAERTPGAAAPADGAGAGAVELAVAA